MRSLRNKDELEAFYAAGDSHRAVAIVWAAVVENRLSDLLKAAMRKDAKAYDELFNPNGPLGAFGTKIRLAYLLGLIDDTKGDLILVNKIRNHFAHKVEINDFDTSPVKEWVAQLSIVEKYLGLIAATKRELRKSSQDQRNEKDLKRKIHLLEMEISDNRSRYHTCIRYLIHTLVELEDMVLSSGHIYANKKQN